MSNDKSMATLEVVWSEGTTVRRETFDTATEATGLYKGLQDQGFQPELYVVNRTRIIF